MERYATLDTDGAAPEGTLTVNGTSLHRACIQARDLSMLVDGADTRGADILVPAASGVLAQPRRETVTRRDVPFWLIGGLSWASGVEQEPRQGLIDNFDLMYASVGVGLQTGDGTVTATLLEPDGASTRSAAVTVLNCRRGVTRAGWWTPVVLSLSVPDGVLS